MSQAPRPAAPNAFADARRLFGLWSFAYAVLHLWHLPLDDAGAAAA